MAVVRAPRPTSDRLIAAATALFAERGFHGTSIRDIAERAGANVAAGHYHYGSKEGLYLQVLRAQFASVRAIYDSRGLTRRRANLDRASRRELKGLLLAQIAAMFDLLLGPPPHAHGALMLREMCDPSEALPIIVAEFIRPRTEEIEAIVSRLAPRARRETVRQTVFSIVGQVLFYRFCMPALLLLLEQPAYPRGFSRRLSRHVTELSLGGLERIGGARTERRRAR